MFRMARTKISLFLGCRIAEQKSPPKLFKEKSLPLIEESVSKGRTVFIFLEPKLDHPKSFSEIEKRKMIVDFHQGVLDMFDLESGLSLFSKNTTSYFDDYIKKGTEPPNFPSDIFGLKRDILNLNLKNPGSVFVRFEPVTMQLVIKAWELFFAYKDQIQFQKQGEETTKAISKYLNPLAEFSYSKDELLLKTISDISKKFPSSDFIIFRENEQSSLQTLLNNPNIQVDVFSLNGETSKLSQIILASKPNENSILA